MRTYHVYTQARKMANLMKEESRTMACYTAATMLLLVGKTQGCVSVRRTDGRHDEIVIIDTKTRDMLAGCEEMYKEVMAELAALKNATSN